MQKKGDHIITSILTMYIPWIPPFKIVGNQSSFVAVLFLRMCIECIGYNKILQTWTLIKTEKREFIAISEQKSV